MEYFAHSRFCEEGELMPESEWQPLSDHLENVAALSGFFAYDPFRRCAFVAGLLHDVGKYRASFQRKLRGSGEAVDHSVCGAMEAIKLFDIRGTALREVISGETNRAGALALASQKVLARFGDIFSAVIAGHHSGLPDMEFRGGSLGERMRKVDEPYDAYKGETPRLSEDVTIAAGELWSFFSKAGKAPYAAYEFLTRYLFSCLVDADYIDTERFFTGREREKFDADWEVCEKSLHERLAAIPLKSPVDAARRDIREMAMKNIEMPSPVYFLDAPTGSGKTLTSLALAVKLLRRTGKKRIIYVSPFTSVIEQTAKVLEDALPGVFVLQHHSDFDPGDGGKEEMTRLMSENWDVPVVVTTFVQFFESIYSNRPSKLRKMHSMAESVLVFDEIHTLPLRCLLSCMTAIRELAADFGSVALFLSATMPDFASFFKKFLGGDLRAVDLCPDKTLYGAFRGCVIERVGTVDPVRRVDEDKSCLVICNRKKTALAFFREYEGETKHCLSSYMTPSHRAKVLRDIKGELLSGKKPKVFSTSITEAGVDLDFECVWRELGGLDSILQAAGRCNREGKRSKNESRVFVFETGEEPFGDLGVRRAAAKACMERHDDIAAPECVREYYDEFFSARDHEIEIGRAFLSSSFDVKFKTVAEGFHLIEGGCEGVVVPCDDVMGVIDALRRGGKADLRKLQRHTANVTSSELAKLKALGAAETVAGVNVLTNMSFYDMDTGIMTDF